MDKAAEIAGVTTIEFKDILADRGIMRELGSRSEAELEWGVVTDHKVEVLNFVFDTDILSNFGQIRRLDYIPIFITRWD